MGFVLLWNLKIFRLEPLPNESTEDKDNNKKPN
jgi:hypothetical protein